jgi:thioesterase domain-containing protein
LTDDAIFNLFLKNLGLPEAESANTGAPGDSLEARLALVHQLMTRDRLLPPNMDSFMMRRLHDLLRENMQASVAYKPPETNLALHVWYRSERMDGEADQSNENRFARILNWFRKPDPTLGWAAVAGKVELSHTPGDHFSMLNEPHVLHLAKELAARLEEITN